MSSDYPKAKWPWVSLTLIAVLLLIAVMLGGV